MAKLFTISEESLRELARLRDLDRRLLAIEAKLAADPRAEDQAGPRTVRWGKTTTNDDFPTYPTSGNTVLVELGDYVYDNSGTGDKAVTWEAYDPPEYRIARTFDGSLPAEGTEVPLQLHHGRWWIESFAGAGIQLGIITGAAALTGRTYTGPLSSISTSPRYACSIVTFEETSSGSGVYQLTKSGSHVYAIGVTSFPFTQDTLVLLVQPQTPNAPWIAIPNISPACNPQLMAYLTNGGSASNNLTSTWAKLANLPSVTWLNTEEAILTQLGDGYQEKWPAYPDRDGITINAPGVYRLSLWGECYITPATDATATAVDIALGDTDQTTPWSTLQTYAVALGEEATTHMIPRVSTIIHISPSYGTFPIELSVFARLRGYVMGDGGAYLKWVRIHVEPAGIGENQTGTGFRGWP